MKSLGEWFRQYKKEEHGDRYKYVSKNNIGKDMKGYSYFKCIDCKKLVRMLTAGVSKEALDNMLCGCGSKRFESITKTEYDELTNIKKILTKDDETKFTPPKDKTKRKHLSTLITRLGQDTYVSPVTEKHGEAKKKGDKKKMAGKGKSKDRSREKAKEKPRRRRGRTLSVDEATGIAHIEEGRYPAELLEIRDIETDYGDSLRWMWEVDVDGEPVELGGITSRRMSEKSHAFGWASALLGEELAVGDEVNLDDLAGLKGMVDVKDGELRDGTEVSNVVDVHPMKRKKAKKVVEEEEEEEEEEPRGKARKRVKKDEELEEEFGEEEEEVN